MLMKKVNIKKYTKKCQLTGNVMLVYQYHTQKEKKKKKKPLDKKKKYQIRGNDLKYR